MIVNLFSSIKLQVGKSVYFTISGMLAFAPLISATQINLAQNNYFRENISNYDEFKKVIEKVRSRQLTKQRMVAIQINYTEMRIDDGNINLFIDLNINNLDYLEIRNIDFFYVHSVRAEFLGGATHTYSPDFRGNIRFNPDQLDQGRNRFLFFFDYYDRGPYMHSFEIHGCRKSGCKTWLETWKEVCIPK